MRAERIAILGDLHGHWSARDNEYFDAEGYDLLLFVGDLGAGTLRDGLSVVRQLAHLKTPGLVLPGNNDALHMPEIHAELAHQSGKAELLRMMQKAARGRLSSCGFSAHRLVIGAPGQEEEVTLLAGRPCAMGGSEFSFREQVQERHGVGSLEGSRRKMRHLIDEVTTQAVLFMAHNGPTGLGEAPSDPWGRDFSLSEDLDRVAPRDWGDSDLRDSIEYAREAGKQVLCVIAGHMHRGKDGAARPLLTMKEEITYINPAVVPRLTPSGAGTTHHHVSLEIKRNSTKMRYEVVVEDRFVELS